MRPRIPSLRHLALACVMLALPSAETVLVPASEATALTPSPSSAAVTWAHENDAILVTVTPGDDAFPGLTLRPAKPWDLSGNGGIIAHVTNLDASPLTLFLRADNAGDWKTNPWNGDQASIPAGAAGMVRIRFGQSWGKPGFALNPAAITELRLWTNPAKVPRRFRIDRIVSDPTSDTAREAQLRPRDGALFGGSAPVIEAALIRTTHSEAHLTTTATGGQTLRISTGDAAGSVTLLPPGKRWDLRDHLAVRIHLRNDGSLPCSSIRARLECADDPSTWQKPSQAIAAGATGEILIPFITNTVWIEGETNNRFASDAVSGLSIAADAQTAVTVLAVEAFVPPAAPLPDWLGKRPPVEGDWAITLDDPFDQTWLDTRIWACHGANYWDKRCHFSAEQVVLGDGTARLVFAAKKGRHNDDAMGVETDYATGFLTTNHRWAQRYGYFECRMKMPTAPGLWPAFWLMPDRGPEAGIWWKRSGTHNGGMEFDIFEYLTRYGPFRTNIAMHWDGYGKEHKHVGSDRIYFQPDSEGFVTTGLLWEPGKASYYINGRQVFRWENARIADVPMHILFTNVSGGWGGNTLDGSGLPDALVIDYVRVWQRADLIQAGP